MKDNSANQSSQANAKVNPTQTRRRFLLGTGALAASSLISKSVFAQSTTNNCLISGFTSVAPSGTTDGNVACNGFSHGAWKTPYVGNPANNPGADGNLRQWIMAGEGFGTMMSSNSSATLFSSSMAHGFMPEAPQQGVNFSGNATHFSGWQSMYNNAMGNGAQVTKFGDIFKRGPVDQTLYSVLVNNQGSMDFDAAAAFLTACYMMAQGTYRLDLFIHPLDIIDLHMYAYDYPSGGAVMTTQGGIEITTPSATDIATFFYQLQHANAVQ